jgi:hypothetical protein
MGVLPLFLACALWGAHEAYRRWRSGPAPPAVWFLIPALLLPSLLPLRRVARAELPPGWKAYFAAADWARDHAHPSDVVCARKPYLFHWRSGLPCDAYPFTDDRDAVLAALEAMNATYVVLETLGYPTTVRYLVPVLQDHPERFERVFASPDHLAVMFRFRGAHETGPGERIPGAVTPPRSETAD